jgi:hypothetical protein
MAQYRQSKYTRGDVDGGNAPSLSVRDVVGKQYDESYEAARQNFVPTRGGRGGKVQQMQGVHIMWKEQKACESHEEKNQLDKYLKHSMLN